jgi:hypothetical protein
MPSEYDSPLQRRPALGGRRASEIAGKSECEHPALLRIEAEIATRIERNA